MASKLDDAYNMCVLLLLCNYVGRYHFCLDTIHRIELEVEYDV